MTFVIRLWISRRRRTKSPCRLLLLLLYCYVASRLGLFMQPNIAFKLQQVPNMFYSIIVQCHKVSCKIYSMAYFVASAYFHHTHDGNEVLGEPERDRSRIQRTFERFDGRLFQTTPPAPVTEAFIISGCLVHSTMRCSLELSVSTTLTVRQIIGDSLAHRVKH